MSSILALDFGTKRIGCALRRDGMDITFPWGIIANDGNAMTAIKRIVAEERVSVVVIGMPRDTTGAHTKQTANVRAFVTLLQQNLSCPIHTIDERFTTQEAHRSVVEGQTASPDEIAASLILDTYVNRNQSKSGDRA